MSVAFATLSDASSPVKVVLVGAGGMGRAWLNTLVASADVELVGVVDLDTELARRAVADAGLSASVTVGTSVTPVAAATGAQAVVNVTVPGAHHVVNAEALFGGLPVLCEKPIAPTVAQALSLAASAEASGQSLMTSQSRRYYATLGRFRDGVRSLGDVGILTTEFFLGPHFGGFRETMSHPLLVDMAIHPFDIARYLLDADPVSVRCDSFNPPWSWYGGDAATSAVFEFARGIRYSYTGSWCSPGLETSWNGSWRASGSAGSAAWDGDGAPTMQLTSADAASPVTVLDAGGPVPEEIAGSLAEFIDALRTGTVPSGEVHSNVRSLAMVEGAVRSADAGGDRVLIADVLEQAYAEALATEQRDDVRSVLAAWGSAAAGLGAASGA
jgi:predicted dehydrogenase